MRSAPHNSGFKPRYRTPANVLDEVEEILDATAPRGSGSRTRPSATWAGRRRSSKGSSREGSTSVRFSAQTRVDRADEEFMRLLKTANFETLELGVETGNPKSWRRSRRDHARAGRACRRAGQGQRPQGLVQFILGHPDETRAQIRDTIDFIAKINRTSCRSRSAILPCNADPRDGACAEKAAIASSRAAGRTSTSTRAACSSSRT